MATFTSSTSSRQAARLEMFAEAVAKAGPRPGELKAKGRFMYVHCPLPGPDGARHEAKGDPGVSLWIDKDGDVVASCRKCCGEHADKGDQIAARKDYTVSLKELIGWTMEPLKKAKVEKIREHRFYDRDFRHAVFKEKIKLNGALQFCWKASPLDQVGNQIGIKPTTSKEFLDANYPEYTRMVEALHWYGIEALLPDDQSEPDLVRVGAWRARQPLFIYITEGEKDADTLNNLLRLRGSANFATCLSHPKPAKLMAHHLALLQGAKVIIIPDADTAGRAQADHMAHLAWDAATDVARLDLPGLTGAPDDKDLSDWVDKRGGVTVDVAKLFFDVRTTWLDRKPPSADDTLLDLGVLAAHDYYKPVYREAADAFYSATLDAFVKLASFGAPRVILKALERAKDLKRDENGEPMPGTVNAAWKNWKGQIFAQLLSELQPASAARSDEATEELGRLLANLLASMVTINPGSGEVRHSLGAWTRRYASYHPGQWARVRSYALWARLGPDGLEVALKPELATQTPRAHPEIAKMKPRELTATCVAHRPANNS